MLAVALLCSLGAVPAPALTLEAATAIALEHANEMIQAREDRILVDADYMDALARVMPSVDLSLSAGEVFAGRRIIESRNPVAAQLPTELPQVTFGAFRDARTNNYSNPQLSLAVTARQLIYDGGRWWKVLKRVDDIRDAREAALQGVQNEIRARVARGFYELEKARRAITTVRSQLDLDHAQVARAKALVAAGRGKPADVALAERNLLQDQIQLHDFVMQASRARRAFNVSLGRPTRSPAELVLGATVTATRALAPRYVPDVPALESLARAHRPELSDRREQIEAARKDVDIAMADYWPVVSVEARYARSSRRPDRVINNPFDNYLATVDLALRWNLFEGHGTRARVERAVIGMRKQVAQLNAVEREVIGDVEDRHEDLKRLRAVHALTRRQIASAAEAARLARGLFEAGRGTGLELRDAELGETRARLAAISARLDIEIAFAELVRSVGTSAWQAP